MVPKVPYSYSAIIFDLDGTLANTLDDIAGSMNRVLKAHRYAERPVNDYKLLVGRGLDNLVRTALPEHARVPEIVDQCLHEMIADYDQNCLVKTHLYDGILEVLHQFQRSGIPMAVFSNKAEPLTLKIVKALLADIDFVSVTGARPDLPKKPDPTGALRISEKMGIPPGKIIYTGDSDVDMITAKRAGMLSVGVSWGFRSVEELKNNGADLIIRSSFELTGLLKR
jgi:phosphoglycolate phosphatase